MSVLAAEALPQNGVQDTSTSRLDRPGRSRQGAADRNRASGRRSVTNIPTGVRLQALIMRAEAIGVMPGAPLEFCAALSGWSLSHRVASVAASSRALRTRFRKEPPPFDRRETTQIPDLCTAGQPDRGCPDDTRRHKRRPRPR